MIDNTFNGSDIYNGLNDSPRWLEVLTASWLCVLLLCGVSFNGAVLVIFIRLRLISVFYNILISALLVNNLSLSLLAFPFAIVTEFSRGWLANLTLESCNWYAFLVYFLGITSMFLHTAISLTRYYVVTRSHNENRTITVYVTWWIVVSCYFISLVLALGPIFGLGSYGFEEHGTSCGLAWNDTRLVNKIYLFIVLVLTFAVPTIVMVVCYGSIYRRMRRTLVVPEARTSARVVAQQKQEKRIQNLSVFMVVSFMISWTPYAIVSFYQAFGPGIRLSPIITRLPAVVAKTCVLWDPIIYAFNTGNFRKQARILFRFGERVSPGAEDSSRHRASNGASIPGSDVQE